MLEALYKVISSGCPEKLLDADDLALLCDLVENLKENRRLERST